MIDRTPPTLSTEQVAQVLRLLRGTGRVELTLRVPVEAQIRQVVFFDTPDLALDRRGVAVRARRLLTKAQRAHYTEQAPECPALDDLAALDPITVVELEVPPAFPAGELAGAGGG